MRKLTLFFIAFLAISFLYSCNDSEESITNMDLPMTDADLIEAIRSSSDKQNLDRDALPVSSQQTISTDYSSNFVSLAQIANGLGYEVTVRLESGINAGQHQNIYFNLEGEQLFLESASATSPSAVGCFSFVFPISFTMPDASTITLNQENDWMLLGNWYLANPYEVEGPIQNFPVDIQFENGTILTVNNEQTLMTYEQNCIGGGCYDILFPLTFVMPDGSNLVINQENDWILIENWYLANPNAMGEPVLSYPFSAEFEDGTTTVVNNEVELELLDMQCSSGPCFELVYPYSVTMPDGSIITLNDASDETLIENWYLANPNATTDPVQNFPLDVIKLDLGVTVTIGNQTDFDSLLQSCH